MRRRRPYIRDIVKQIYGFAILHGEKVANPADEVGPSSIAAFKPKDRSLSPIEIRVTLKMLEHVPTLPTIRDTDPEQLLSAMGRYIPVAKPKWIGRPENGADAQ